VTLIIDGLLLGVLHKLGGIHGGDPLGGESLLILGEELKATDIVLVPEEELEVLGIVLDIDKVVHEVVQRTGLYAVSLGAGRERG
jgi:hypothetical protein